MEKEDKLADVREYLSLLPSEREAIVKARIGQGRFRDSLIEYWSACAVTGCAENALLVASHIKPWAKAELVERLSLYNGLLLSPALDACFDSGYISFDDEGKILISERLTRDDARALGIHTDMLLRRVEPQHKKYLAFHRDHIFKR
jgi:predicted restriction endonuclease